MRVVSLFSGAGGLDKGLQLADCDIVWANDIDSDSAKTYSKNIGEHIVLEDISNIKSDDIPEADIVIGGFPCQGFSMANKFRDALDERNTLYLEMLRVIRDKQPKWFVAENVRGILSLNGGAVFKAILRDFDSAGYRVKTQIVNMADHGVPQLRRRVVLLGTRRDLPEYLDASHPQPSHAKESWKSVQKALDDLEVSFNETPDLPNNTGSKYKVEYRNFTGHRQTDPSSPCPTILARGNGKGGVCAIPHPSGERRLTVRESATMQTFPPDFEFYGSINSQYRQIGNAVPVLYGQKLGQMFNKLDQQIDQVSSSSAHRALRVASLFAGAGGLDLGFKNAGYELVWANDNDSDSCKTYNQNFGDHCVHANIEDIDLSLIPDVDVIIGGFPCQGFSLANTGRHIDDSRNVLYKSFVKAVETKKPKYFLAENVKGILSIGNGTVFKRIMREFSESGYRCEYALVNAADYGTPQSRQRVLIFGVRDDLNQVDFSWPPTPSHINKHISIGAALSGIPDPESKHQLKNHVYSAFKLKFNGYISNRRIDPEKPSPTITARGDMKGGAMIIHHPNNLRRITCREAAVIQGFPMDFDFYGSMTSVYRQIGNAVPSQLALAAANAIKEYDLLLSKKAGKVGSRILEDKTSGSFKAAFGQQAILPLY